eukprot:CAMPEP_0170409202 /NCGR_PEP_ID=MMETSP0117_2-20130122/29213_1 /TAXON_ID=400756 /ORGANISM="Durinskia baltica, Strain CSIRO CS-38" /LENGTH=384 /DNA_ID=CAMNT_0010666617 /DNA_START=25 /DNA_END=1179 /DNA_ORIENTATION=-
MSERKRRVNGLQPPWHEFQVATWVLFPVILVHYYAFLMHLLWRPDAVVIVLTILFSLFAISCGVSAYITLSIDPIDDAVLCLETSLSRDPRSKGGTVHCFLCEKDVDHSSKHCRFCDKCILCFDHHCKWLNTCIGRKNYAYFLSIVVSVFLLTTESLGISVALVIEAFAYPDSLMDRVQYHDFLEDRIGSDLSLAALQGLLLTSAVVLFGIVAMIIQLGSFHMMLLWRGMTTYDFIVSEQKRLREKQNVRLQKKVEKQQREQKSKVRAVSDNSGAGANNNDQQVGAGAAGGASSGVEMREASGPDDLMESPAASFRRTLASVAGGGGGGGTGDKSTESSVRRYAPVTSSEGEGEGEGGEDGEGDGAVVSYDAQRAIVEGEGYTV